MSEPEQPQFRLGDDGEIEGGLAIPEVKPKRRSRVIHWTRRTARLTFWLIIIALSGLGGATAVYILSNNKIPVVSSSNFVVTADCPHLIEISGKSGKLLTSSIRFRDNKFYSDLYVSNFEGTERNLLKRSLDGLTYRLSPDGKRIITSRTENRVRYLFLYDTETFTERRLRTGEQPGWASDSQRIAFVNEGSLYILHIDTEAVILIGDNIVQNSASPVIWSPDGRYVAITSSDGRSWSLVLIDIDNHTKTTIVNSRSPVSEPDWSPDGKYIAYSTTADIHLVPTDTSGLTTPLNLTKGAFMNPTHVVWSPDSKQIAFVNSPTTAIPVYTVNTINVDGSGARYLYSACDLPTE